MFKLTEMGEIPRYTKKEVGIMHTFDAQSLTARENYKLLIGSIIPRPIAFVTTLNQDASVNAAPFSFFNIVNNHPPMIAIAVQRAGGKRKILP